MNWAQRMNKNVDDAVTALRVVSESDPENFDSTAHKILDDLLFKSLKIRDEVVNGEVAANENFNAGLQF